MFFTFIRVSIRPYLHDDLPRSSRGLSAGRTQSMSRIAYGLRRRQACTLGSVHSLGLKDFEWFEITSARFQLLTQPKVLMTLSVRTIKRSNSPKLRSLSHTVLTLVGYRACESHPEGGLLKIVNMRVLHKDS